jgi:2-polyprenyl-6-methoxyphenol hydroxylase-like FAD-dependent oxidoreductase
MLLSFAILFCILEIGASFKSATIVGSGPVGLAAALVLAKRHGYTVTILEIAERTDIYDPRKGYPFLIGERGQKVTNLFPSVHKALQENGVGVEGATKVVSVPADADELLNLEPKEFTIFRPKGERFWIRRHEFTRLLLDAVAEEENISIVNGVSCKSIKQASDSDIIVCVDCTSPEKSNIQEYKSSLVIAADGMNSAVRESLSQSPSPLSGWQNNKPSGFKPRRWR